MLTGYNTDAVFDGTPYHVQSEDRGADNPVLETLVYCGGRILHQERVSYAERLAAGASEDEIAAMLERQHRRFVRRARHGAFADELKMPFADAEPPGGLGEAIVACLELDEETRPLEVLFLEQKHRGGLTGLLQVRDPVTLEPRPEAGVRVRLVGPGLAPVDLLEARTDARGELAVALALPPGAATAVLFQVEDGPRAGRFRHELQGPRRFSASAAAPARSPAGGSSA